MSSENHQPPSDPLDAAIAALRGAAHVDEMPSPALVAATIDALKRLDATLPTNTTDETATAIQLAPRPAETTADKQASLTVAKPSHRVRRIGLWAAVLAAAACVAVVVTRPPKPPDLLPHSEDHRFGPIVVAELDPRPVYTRMEEQIAQAQNETVVMIEEAKRLMAEEQITRLLADNREFAGTTQEN